MSFGLTAAGFTAPRAADFLEIIRDAMESELGVTIDWSNNAFFGHSTNIHAQQLGELGEALQTIYDAWVKENANGLPLDDLGQLINVWRIQATKSTCEFLLLGDATSMGKVVDSGTMFEGGDAANPSARWTLDDDVVLQGAVAVAANITAVDYGDITAVATTIDKIVTPKDGLISATNFVDASPGVPLELDAPYRARQRGGPATGGRSMAALRADLLALDGVTSAGVADNPEAYAQVVEGVLMDAHSVAVTVAPSTLTTAQQQAVAEAVYAQVAYGIKTMGTETFTVTAEDGFPKPVAFYFATNVPVDVDTLVSLKAGYTLAGVEDDIEAAVVAYFATLATGGDVLHHLVEAAVSSVAGLTQVAVELNSGTANISIGTSETAVINAQTVGTGP